MQINQTKQKTINYELKDMTEWQGVDADLAITDPPFGIDFNGKAENYNRDTSNVVEGYVEWEKDEYFQKCDTLLSVLKDNLADDGQALIFSGWNNSPSLHKACLESDLTLEGKMYWEYNFAPYCSRRPAHNVYEIYWVVNEDRWYYDNECSHDHCQEGEANLSAMEIPRNYHKDIPKYPTRLPEKVVSVLLEHYSEKGDTVFDPLAGSGMVGCVARNKERNAVLGDLNSEAKSVYHKIKEKILNE